LLQQDFSLYDLSSLKYCTTAGEALNADIFNKFLAKTGLSMKEGYGQTECTLAIGNFPWMAPRPGSMGKPAPGYDIDIIDSNGNPCKPNEVGEIVIHLNNGRPFGLFAGYYRDQKMTENVFSTDLYHTGDTAWKDEDGYFWFVGRTDDLIKTSGYRVSPFEVESTLQQHPAVLECAVTGVNDRMRNQVVKATIVLSKGFEATKELAADIQKYTKQVAASYKSPRIIEFVSELPKTISGKIRRATIRETDNKTGTTNQSEEKES
jgi:acetyl-CoA synthetase